MNRAVNKRTEGFTIIELMLAMSFVAMLLLAIALSILQIAQIYNKGMTLKEVNQTGRNIGAEFSRNLGASDAFALATNLRAAPGNAGGRLCLGQYSYVWNYSAALAAGNSNVIRHQAAPFDEIHLLKVPDSSGAYCAMSGSSFVYPTVRTVDRPQSVELLKSGDRLLSIHQFSMSTVPGGADVLTGQQLYTTSFTIGTGIEPTKPSPLTPDNTQCLPPGNINANFAYCAVQQFTLVIRAGNKVN